MSDRIFVGTRKGLFQLERGTAGRWRLTPPVFLGDPVSMVLADPRDGAVYAALDLGHFGVKLHRSTDGGETFDEINTPLFPKMENPDTGAPFVELIWALEPGGPNTPGDLWCGTRPGGLFRSQNGGRSWSLIESLWERPERQSWSPAGFDRPAMHSVCVDSRDSARVAVAISSGGVWVTRDAGASWEPRCDGMRQENVPPGFEHDISWQDPHRLVQCAAAPDVFWVQHHNGIFRSTDGCASWREIESAGPSTFGFAVAVHPTDPDTAWFVPGVKDACRLPVDARLVVTRTRDGGRTFDVLSDGLPQEHCYDLIYRHALDVDATGDRLAFGSTTGGLWITENGGDSWQTVSVHLPPIYCVRFG